MRGYIIKCEAANSTSMTALVIAARSLGVNIISVAHHKESDITNLAILAEQDPEQKAKSHKVARLAALELLTGHSLWPIVECVAPEYNNRDAAVTYIAFLIGKMPFKFSDLTAPDLTLAYDELCGIDAALKDWMLEKEQSAWSNQDDATLISSILSVPVVTAYGRPLLSHDEIRRATRELVRRQIANTGENHPDDTPTHVIRQSAPPVLPTAPTSNLQDIIDQGKAQARMLGASQQAWATPPERHVIDNRPDLFDNSIYDDPADSMEKFFA